MWIAESWVNGPTQLFLKFLQLRSVHTSVDRFQYFFSLTLKFYGDFKFDIVVYLKWLSEPETSNLLINGLFWKISFSLTWKFDRVSKSDIVVYLKWLTEPPKSIFCLWTNFNNFFSFDWKFIKDSKLDIEVYLKWLSEPQGPISLFMDHFQQIFFLSIGDSKSNIEIYFKCLSEPLNPNFVVRLILI